ncbi:unnamed protein product [Enterobius vermicularis]|uniref:Uncharacterized protein n=1 Tax=Enterobius vermicularis TaxID=51028 RepID=A0A0N4VGV7_ENTVE|nr:unnamed protein product [Enterobius vermicularis]
MLKHLWFLFSSTLCILAQNGNTVPSSGLYANEIINQRSNQQAEEALSPSVKEYSPLFSRFSRKWFLRRPFVGNPFRRAFSKYNSGFGTTSDSLSTSFVSPMGIMKPTAEQVARAIKNFYSLSSRGLITAGRFNQPNSYGTSMNSAYVQPTTGYISYAYGNSQKDFSYPNNLFDSYNPYSTSRTYSTEHDLTSTSYNPQPYDTNAFSSFNQDFYHSLSNTANKPRFLRGLSGSLNSAYRESLPAFFNRNTQSYGSSIPIMALSKKLRSKLSHPNPAYSYGRMLKSPTDASVSQPQIDSSKEDKDSSET